MSVQATVDVIAILDERADIMLFLSLGFEG
jgi:hypothetical protein